MKKLLILVFLYVSAITFGQSLEKKWNFLTIENTKGEQIIPTSNDDFFNISNGNFEYFLKATDSLNTSGTYIHQNNLLIFKFQQPNDTVRYYNVVELTDTNLTLSENNIL